MFLHTFTLLLSFLLAVTSLPQNPSSYGSNTATTTVDISNYTDEEIASGAALVEVAALSNKNLQASGACSMQSARPRPEW